jgi:hypothetical protein
MGRLLPDADQKSIEACVGPGSASFGRWLGCPVGHSNVCSVQQAALARLPLRVVIPSRRVGRRRNLRFLSLRATNRSVLRSRTRPECAVMCQEIGLVNFASDRKLRSLDPDRSFARLDGWKCSPARRVAQARQPTPDASCRHGVRNVTGGGFSNPPASDGKCAEAFSRAFASK